MNWPSKPILVALILVLAAALAATAGTFSLRSASAAAQPDASAVVGDAVQPTGLAMTFGSGAIPQAVGVLQDLYEPTITVSGTGAIYVAGHVAGALTTGTPAFVSTNNGVTWKELPAVSTVNTYPVQGSAQPGGDEGIVVADATVITA